MSHTYASIYHKTMFSRDRAVHILNVLESGIKKRGTFGRSLKNIETMINTQLVGEYLKKDKYVISILLENKQAWEKIKSKVIIAIQRAGLRYIYKPVLNENGSTQFPRIMQKDVKNLFRQQSNYFD